MILLAIISYSYFFLTTWAKRLVHCIENIMFLNDAHKGCINRQLCLYGNRRRFTRHLGCRCQEISITFVFLVRVSRFSAAFYFYPRRVLLLAAF